jgi:transcriptional regulator with XRE-family HTH domain
VDVCLVIQQRLKELGLEQRDLAAAAQVTESYISQLLTRKKAPPAPNRTDIYEKMNAFLKLPNGHLSAIVEAQRQEQWKKTWANPPAPLYREVRDLIIRKCQTGKQKQVREIFEKQAFGELERLVTQKLLDVTKRTARAELENERWLRRAAKLRKLSYEEARTVILEFLDTDIFNISAGHCAAFLAPLIESWDIDLTTFAIRVNLNRLLSPVQVVTFQFVERDEEGAAQVEPGFEEFLRLPDLSAGATEEELEFLRTLRFKRRRPTAMFYYRQLQNLRDPLHFGDRPLLQLYRRRDLISTKKQTQLDSRKKAIRRWTRNTASPKS